MEYLVESHMGGHYISNCDPEIIEAICDQCGDFDRIILSWENGEMLDTLLEYFSYIKRSVEQLEKDKNELDLMKEELIDSLTWSYDEDRYLICELSEDGIISPDEKKTLLKQITCSQKRQFETLKSIYYPNGYVRVNKFNNKNKRNCSK